MNETITLETGEDVTVRMLGLEDDGWSDYEDAWQFHSAEFAVEQAKLQRADGWKVDLVCTVIDGSREYGIAFVNTDQS